VRKSKAEILFAVHSFTPVYEGRPRHLEVGILYDTDEELAVRVRDRLAEDGLEVKLNEPYSGKEGLIYSADFHAAAHSRCAVEIEVRQDLVVDDAFRRRLVDALTRAFF
jgi:predicted N-formylglutamate amidohydrolase